MSKYKEPHPSLYKYFKNLFQDSIKFKEKIYKLKDKYNIKRKEWETLEKYLYWDNVMFFYMSEEVVEDRYNEEDKKTYYAFNEDLLKLAKEYFLDNYIKEFKNYILWRWFDPLFQKSIKCNRDGIQINLALSVTKEEFNKIWNEILEAKAFAKNNFLEWIDPGLKNRKSSEFDTKILLYNFFNNWYIPSESERLKIYNIELVQREKWLKEVKKWLELINKS